MRSFSIIDALDTFILGVKWRFEVCRGLVHYSHPFQGKLAAPHKIGAHLVKKETVTMKGVKTKKDTER